MDRRKFIASNTALAVLGGLGSGTARAQLQGTAFIISGFPPGGIGDYVARPLIEKMRGKYATNLLLENKPGAGGRIAIEYVKRASPDGLTMLISPSSPLLLYPNTYKKLNYDTFADFIPVTTTVSFTFSFTAGPALPANIRTVDDYVKWAKANPRLANYGIPAAGSALHFAGMMLQKAAGIQLNSIPYRGGGPLLTDLLGGQVPVSFNVLGEVLPYVRSGTLRSLAVCTSQRSIFLPDVPTMAEQGFKDVTMMEYLSLFLPAKTPKDIVMRLNTSVREGLRSPDLIESLAKNGLQPIHQSPEEFATLARQEYEQWGAMQKATGFTAED